MNDLELVEQAARQNGENIRRSVWMEEGARSFLGNAFLAFADDLKRLRKEREDAANRFVTAKMSEDGIG